ncbi:hypothetical protein [Segniliparus rugosus]|uniref:Uncharacterized protein n=1 Tax=Segniliparus rugosus (strain ATCC BAA-974 / DSM 45345 / CCUG 50838 / CIP 108380 / JCM 13579 / CDC 945) TaxID=679197 RepID=E5XQD9_SEGRC|nr:hypothetical protein [Segniliparus rugosus]EFV13422.1 hypothetical protein HMPREF9336_01711 [Segniliparus rugosus ATCC BAA-974]
MIVSQQLETTTRAFARVLGPYLVIVMAAAGSRASDLRGLLASPGQSLWWAWVTGAFVLLCGVIVLALHPYWRGAAAVMVSALGALTALKGLALMVFPTSYLAFAKTVIGGPAWFAGLAAAELAGLYLVYVGWAPRRRDQAERAENDRGRPSHVSHAA